MDFYQKILQFIHGWEAEHAGQPPTFLQLHPNHQEEYGNHFDYRDGSLRIIYSPRVPVNGVNGGQELVLGSE